MSTKITFYTHHKYHPYHDSLDTAYDERLEGEYDIQYFKYIPLKAINDTLDDIVNYVTVKYGSWYKEIIQKMKDGVRLRPINLRKKPDKKGIFTLDLYKEDKIMFLASKHMGYNYIPAIIKYSLNAPITYLPIKSKGRIKPGTWIKLSEPYTRSQMLPKNKHVMVIDRFSHSKHYRRSKKYPRESGKIITYYNYDIAYLNYKKGRKRTLDIEYNNVFDDCFTLECSQPSKKYQKMFIKQLCARPPTAGSGCNDAIEKIAREKGIEYIDKNKSVLYKTIEK